MSKKMFSLLTLVSDSLTIKSPSCPLSVRILSQSALVMWPKYQGCCFIASKVCKLTVCPGALLAGPISVVPLPLVVFAAPFTPKMR